MLASDAKSYSSNSVMAGLHFLQVHLLPFSCATSVLECLCGQSCAPGPHKAYALAWGCYDQGHMALVPSEVVLDTKDMMVSEVLLLCEKTLRNYANIAYRLCIWTNELRAQGRLDAEAVHLCAATNEALGRLGGMAESMRWGLYSLTGPGARESVVAGRIVREWLATATLAMDIVSRGRLVDKSGNSVYDLNVSNTAGRSHTSLFFREPHHRPFIENSGTDSAAAQRAAMAASEANCPDRRALPEMGGEVIIMELPGDCVGDSSGREGSQTDASDGSSSSEGDSLCG